LRFFADSTSIGEQIEEGGHSSSKTPKHSAVTLARRNGCFGDAAVGGEYSLLYLDQLSHVVRSMAMHRDQHKVVDCSVLEQPAADNLATIVNGDDEHGIQVPVGASRKECG